MRQSWLRFLRAGTWVCAGAIVLVALILACLHLSRTQRWILSRLQKTAETSGLILTADRLDYNLFHRTAELHNATLRARDHKEPFLSAGFLSVSWKYADLRSGLSALEDIRMDRVVVTIRRDKQGSLNLPQSGSDGTTPLRGIPGRTIIRQLAFTYEDGPTRISLPQLDANFQGASWQADLKSPGSLSAQHVSTAVQALHLEGRVHPLDWDHFRAEGTAGFENLRIRNQPPLSLRTDLAFDVPSQRLNLKNTHAEAVRRRLDGEASLSLANLPSSATARIEYDGLHATAKAAWPGLNFDRIEAAGYVESRRKDIQGRAEVRATPRFITAAILRISAAGLNATGNVRVRLPSLALDGELRGEVPSLQAIAERVDGKAEFQAHLGGTATNPRAEIDAISTGVSIGGLRDVQLALHGSWAGRTAHVDEGSVNWNGQLAHVTGDLTWKGKDAELDFEVKAPDLRVQPVIELLKPDLPIDGRLTVLAHVNGTLSTPQVQATVNGEDLTAWGEPFGRMETAIESTGSRIDIKELQIIRPQADTPGQMNAQGWVDMASRSFHGTLDTNRLEFDNLRPPWGEPLHAAVELNAALEGTFDEPRGKIALHVVSEKAGSLKAEASLDQNGIQFSASSPDLRSDPFGVPGSASVTLRGTAPWEDLRKVSGEATLADASIEYQNHKLVSSGPLELALADERLIVRRAQLESESAKASISGSLPLQQASDRDRLQVQGEIPLSLAERYLPDAAKLQLAGTLALNGEISGTLAKPVPDLHGSLSGAEATIAALREPIRTVDAQIHLRPDRVEVQSLKASIGEGTLSGTGSIPLGTGEMRFSLDVHKLDPAALLGKPESKTTSTVTAHVEATSPSREIKDVVASVRATELSVTTPLAKISQSGDTSLSLKDGVLTVDRMVLASESNTFEAGGTVELVGAQKLDLRMDGNLEAHFLSRTSTDYGISGPVAVDLKVTGTIPDPQIRGEAELKGGRLVLADTIAVAGDRIDARLVFTGQEVRIESARASLNGGIVTGSGTLSIRKGTIDTADVKLSGRSVFLEYPKGLQSASDFDLTLRNQGRTLLLGGKIAILDGSYRNAFNLAAIAASRLRQVTMVEGTPNEFLARLRFDVEIDTRQPIVVDNNLGRINADANVRFIGTAMRPALTGRFEIEEGGRVYFSGRTFNVVRGIVDFTDESRIAPRFDLEADSTIGEYVITLKLTGDIDKTETAFTSDPSLNEDQILSLLFTGSPDNAGKTAAYGQSQMLSLFGTGVTGELTTRVRNTVGLSELRIDPGLVSADKNPTARLTVGQNFTPEFRITYSINLTDSQDQIWTAEYDWRRRFLARFYRESTQSNRMELRQKFRLGGGPNAGDYLQRKSRPKLRIGEVAITGDPVFDEKTILHRLKLKPGQSYRFLQAQQALERLKTFYAKSGYAEARIYQERETEGGITSLTFQIEAGRPVKFVFEGASPSNSLQRNIARTWQQGIIDSQRLGTANRTIRQQFIRDGYADATVTGAIRDNNDVRTVVFEIVRGKDFGRPHLLFPGTTRSVAGDLKSVLRGSRLDMEVKSNSSVVIDAMTQHLKNEGYLAAEVSEPVVTVVGDQLQAAIPVKIGPAFQLGSVQFQGAHALKEDQLTRALLTQKGNKYVPQDRYTLAQRVQQLYWNTGYREADVEVEEHLDNARGQANLLLKIQEGQQFRVASIQVQGLSETSEGYLRKRLNLSEGDVLRASAINQSRRNLLDSGAYNLMDFTYPAANVPAPAPGVQPVNLLISVREPKPYRIDIGGTYDTDRGAGVLADISTANTLGEARTLGFRTTVDRLKQDYRLYFTQPFLGKSHITSTASTYITHERRSAFFVQGFGATLQQNVRIHRRWNLSYGYQFEDASLNIDELGFLFRGTTSALISSMAFDSRDMLLDATRGSFLSAAVEYGPAQLGGSIDYYRTYLQASRYFGLSPRERVPFEGELLRSRIIFATNIRAGFANTLGTTEILPVDRFFAGGGTTVRGYAQDSIGPTLPDGTPIGGGATLILNNELRFPLYKFVDGVAFIDNGNVWISPSSLTFRDLRTGAGFGLRVRNPFVLLRFDYGWKVGRQPGESAGAFFFSIGQAF